MRNLLTLLLGAVLLTLGGVAASAQSFEYQVATNGKSYTLAYVRAVPESRINADWKDVTWSFGPVGGAEVNGPGVLGLRAHIQAIDHNSGFYASFNIDGLFPAGSRPIGVGGLSFGFQVPVRT